MTLRRAIASLLLLTVVLVPVLGVAGDDLSASSRGPHHETGLRHQPPPPWRTLPAIIEAPAAAPRVSPLATLVAPEPERTLPLLIRTPFIPPRG
jgi:hypothetical protein